VIDRITQNFYDKIALARPNGWAFYLEYSMELGSKTHKQLLRKAILKTALKTFSLGAIIGVMLMIPSLVRENSFSLLMEKIGLSIILISFAYASYIAWKKSKSVFKDF